MLDNSFINILPHITTFVCKTNVGGKDQEVIFDLNALVPKLSEDDPVVQEMLGDSDSINMQILAFMEYERSRLDDIQYETRRMFAKFVTYFTNVPQLLLARQLGLPALNNKPPTESFLKKVTEYSEEIYGIKTNSYDHSDQVIFDGNKYRKLSKEEEQIKSNLRMLKDLYEQRRSLLNSVRSLNSNYRLYLQSS